MASVTKPSPCGDPGATCNPSRFRHQRHRETMTTAGDDPQWSRQRLRLDPRAQPAQALAGAELPTPDSKLRSSRVNHVSRSSAEHSRRSGGGSQPSAHAVSAVNGRARFVQSPRHSSSSSRQGRSAYAVVDAPTNGSLTGGSRPGELSASLHRTRLRRAATADNEEEDQLVLL